MSTAFRLKSFPEILANAFARSRAILGVGADLNIGSVLRTTFEIGALSDADQYIQIGKLLKLFSLDDCTGDDLDRRALDLGALFFIPLRRMRAQSSVVKVSVGDGSFLVTARFATDVTVGSSYFSVGIGEGDAFPSAGALYLERGSVRQERVIYARSGDVFFIPSGVAFAHVAYGEVVRIATQSILVFPTSIGGTGVTLASDTGAAWPATGTAIFERGTSREERKAFTRAGDALFLGATLAFPHAAGSYVVLSTAGSARSISAGLQVFSPATETSKQVMFQLATTGVLQDGDFSSDLIDAVCQSVGQDTNVGSGTVSKFTSLPFTGAVVTNPLPAVGGANQEKDDAYRTRLKSFAASQGRGSALAVDTLTTGSKDEATNSFVAFAQVVEPVTPGVSQLYISDGSADFSIGYQPFLGRDVVISNASTGDRLGRLHRPAPFQKASLPLSQRTPRIFVSVVRGTSSSVGVEFLEDTTQSLTTDSFSLAAGQFWLKTADDQFFRIVSNTAIRFSIDAGGGTPPIGPFTVFNFGVAPLVPGVDFQFNATNGDLELTTPLVRYDAAVAASDGALPAVGAYTYATGLGALVQRVVNGDPTDFTDFPGIRSTGTQIMVSAPTPISPTFEISIIPGPNSSTSKVAPLVQSVVQTYVNSLGIGDDVILTEIIRLVKGLPGVADLVIAEPGSNVSVGDGQLARIAATDVFVS